MDQVVENVLKAFRPLRITISPAQLDGLPCIRGLRIPLATIVDMVAVGMEKGEILSLYPDLEPDDIQTALRYAAVVMREHHLPRQ